MGIKVIFLDIDGVLNCSSTVQRKRGCPGQFGIDPAKTAMLNAITAKTGARIVLSSTWRKDEDWREVMLEYGVLGVIDRTPSLGLYGYENKPRGHEIAAWLAEHPEVDRYAILDDDSDMLPDQPLFKTSWSEGLTQKIADDVAAFLLDGRRPRSRS